MHSVLKQKSSGPTPAEINTELRSVVPAVSRVVCSGQWWSVLVAMGSVVVCISVISFWFPGRSLKQRLSNCERSFKTPSKASTSIPMVATTSSLPSPPRTQLASTLMEHEEVVEEHDQLATRHDQLLRDSQQQMDKWKRK